MNQDSLNYFIDKIRKLPGKVTFYGAGNNMEKILQMYEYADLTFNYDIWDINAERISQLKGHKVYLPDFLKKISYDRTMVITLGDKAIAEDVTDKLSALGWNVIDGVVEILGISRDNAIVNSRPMNYPIEFSTADREILNYIRENELTMVSDERLFATLSACKYVILNNIKGDFVECGVWRGGNAMVAAAVIKMFGSDKKVWLFDTFAGFTNINPTSKDSLIQTMETVTKDMMAEYHKSLYDISRCGNSIDDVRDNFEKYGLLNDNVIFVKGDVMQTLDLENIPAEIAVLRLDTDLYESTKKEMEILYPKITKTGVLMVDDYGFCDGARSAVDEYFENIPKPLMQCIDHEGRLAIKI